MYPLTLMDTFKKRCRTYWLRRRAATVYLLTLMHTFKITLMTLILLEHGN